MKSTIVLLGSMSLVKYGVKNKCRQPASSEEVLGPWLIFEASIDDKKSFKGSGPFNGNNNSLHSLAAKFFSCIVPRTDEKTKKAGKGPALKN